MARNRFQCPACGTLTNSLRCPQCGTDTQDCDNRADVPVRDAGPRAYSIFDHAQHGHVRNALVRAHATAQRRRFTGSGFGALA
jgi:tRNA(Ile2) C34 agmatinyltransferase TiaS